MGMHAVVAYLHYASFMLLYGALAVEAVTLKQELSLKEAWQLLIADGIYGIAATLALITGILRVLYFGQGSDFYLSNPVFYIKVGLFIFVGLLSLYPTISFLTWIPTLRQHQLPKVESAAVSRLQWVVRLELLGFITIPLFAALMARGIGLGWV